MTGNSEEQLGAELRALEERLLHEDFSGHPGALDQLLGEELEEIAPNGVVVSRGEVVRWLLAKDPRDRWTLTEFTSTPLAEDLVLNTYMARQTEPVEKDGSGSRRSSIWRLSNGGWTMIFHQATKLG